MRWPNILRTINIMKLSIISRTLLLTVAAAGLSGFTPAAKADDSALSGKDKSFIQDAYQDGLAEVATAQLVEGKATNANVKAFAEKIVTDHTAANSELKTLADNKKVSVAAEPSMVSKGKSKMLDMKSGADFDKAYIDSMITDHKKDIEAFEKEVTHGKDQDLKNFASKTLPSLKAHLSAAEAIQGQIGK